MSFTALTFWVFFGGVLLGYRLLPFRAQNRFLLIASMVFYGCWDWRFLGLLWITITADFIISRAIYASDDSVRRKRLIITSLVINLGILATFKYANFFVAEASSFLDWIGVNHSLPVLSIVLPVGISFYTFQSLSYSLDVYRRQLEPVNSIGDFALFVSFFPQLVAGPIERAARLLPQITKPRSAFTESQFRDGLYLILFGLLMKTVVADNLAPLVNHCFSLAPDQMSGFEAILGAYAFTFQIYGDFYGYSSIAQGIALWMGFELMFNFRNPFFSASITEFWQRWHISLSSWLRDYLFYSLSGFRSRWKPYRNILITMALAGLWHGADWTFLVFGVVFAVCMIIERIYQELRPSRKPVPALKPFKILVTFHIVVFAMLFFRGESIEQVWGFFTALGDWQSPPSDVVINGFAQLAWLAVPLLAFESWQHRKDDLMFLARAPWKIRALVLSLFALLVLYMHAPQTVDFIYFQF
jgi:D-alanyl-lipoteichoic acid acyltransferase DltB (MBOAT superfamily)